MGVCQRGWLVVFVGLLCVFCFLFLGGLLLAVLPIVFRIVGSLRVFGWWSILVCSGWLLFGILV